MPSNHRHDTTIASLGRYWDALLQGRPADPSSLAPALAETVRTLHARDDAPGADLAFAARLRAHLEDRMDTTYPDLLPSPVPLSLRPDRLTPVPPPSLTAPARAGWRWRLSPAPFASAALVLVALAAVFIGFGSLCSGWLDEQPTMIPAIAALATPTPDAATSMLAVTLPPGAFPADVIGGLNHYTVAPGSTARWDWTCCTGTRLDYILSGTYAIRGDGPTRVLHAGAATWEDVPAGTEVTLGSGDALLSRMEDAFDAVTSGAEPVELLDGVLFQGEPTDDPVPHERSGVRAWSYHDQDLSLAPQPVPPGPTTLRLRQATLAAGGVLPRPPGAVLQFAVGLDEEALVVTQSPTTDTPFELRNLGESPATVYILSLEPADAGDGAPTATSVNSAANRAAQA
jgi:hypothetical protein